MGSLPSIREEEEADVDMLEENNSSLRQPAATEQVFEPARNKNRAGVLSQSSLNMKM